MRTLLLAGTSSLALSASLATATAAPITYDYTGAFQTFIAPTAGTYDILALGASGGAFGSLNNAGGLGAEAGGDFALTAGETLTIARSAASEPVVPPRPAAVAGASLSSRAARPRPW